MKRSILVLILFSVIITSSYSQVFVEAESFTNKGGWVVDQQFINQM